MKKYAIDIHAGHVVLALSVVLFLIVIVGKPNKPAHNTAAYEVLQQHNQSLMRDLEQSKKNYAQLMLEVQQTKSRDSALKAQYQQRILKDYYTIQALNRRKDEKIKVIDGASDSLLRAILANY